LLLSVLSSTLISPGERFVSMNSFNWMSLFGRYVHTLKIAAVVVCLAALSCSCSSDSAGTSGNPLLADFSAARETPPFDAIKPEHFAPAIDAAISSAKASIDAIVNNAEAPTFANTIEALEFSSVKLNTIAGILFNLNSANTNPALQKVVREVSPKLTDFDNDKILNPKLFERVTAVYLKRALLGLTTEQMTLLEKTYNRFVRNGANLDDAGKERYRAISKELSDLSLQFDENLLADTNGYFLTITNEADLAGLPQSVRDAAAIAATQKGTQGWVITLDYPSYVSFMTYSDKRNLREEVYKAYNSIGFKGNQYDNRKVVTRIVELRLELAKLMGYATYAQMSLQDTMAETPVRVNALLQQLIDASMPFARTELNDLEAFAASIGADFKLEKWDTSYYSEKLKNRNFSYSQEDVKPYFQLERVREGIFTLANRLYGITIVPNDTIPVYHPDVRAYEVFDQDGSFLAVLYLDFFPRDGKGSGAWMTSFRSQYKKDGKETRPLVSVVTNFTKPTGSTPALLSFDEVTTFLHEFGHSLHGMLASGTYPSLTGTSVYQDFVELPSQIMENWATEQDFLDLFAVHYLTGEKIPQQLVQKIVASRNFQVGTQSAAQLGYGMLDMAWHSIEAPVTATVADFENAAFSQTSLMPAVPGTCMSVAFSHIFSGGYAAGYYSYKWAEVLDADAFSVFKQNGIFDRATAKSFRDNILSKGGSEPPMVLYKRFRGQEPTIDALLKRSGLL